jgi:hypothetical protein
MTTVSALALSWVRRALFAGIAGSIGSDRRHSQHALRCGHAKDSAGEVAKVSTIGPHGVHHQRSSGRLARDPVMRDCRP